MVQRLLFDRIDAEAGAAAVGGRDHLTVEILPHEAEASLAGKQAATAGAEVALEAFGVVGVAPPAGWPDAVVRGASAGGE